MSRWAPWLLGAAFLAGCGPSPKVNRPVGPPEVLVAEALSRDDLVDSDEFTGYTEALDRVEIRAMVTGFLDKVHFASESTVKEGDLLFELDRRTFDAELKKAKASVAVAKTTVDEKEKKYKLVDDGYKNKSIAQTEWDKADAELKQAQATLLQAQAVEAQAQLNYDFCTIKAPIGGRLGIVTANKGMPVTAGGNSTLLTSIVKLDPIYVYFTVDERTMLRYQKMIRERTAETGKRPDFPVELQLANETEFKHLGKVDAVDNSLEKTTGTLRVRAKFDNPQAVIFPGEFVRIRISSDRKRSGVLINDRAIGSDQGQKYVIILNEKNEAAYRRIVVGGMHHGLREITEGLKSGERVVVVGLQRVRPGAVVDPKPADMTTLAPR